MGYFTRRVLLLSLAITLLGICPKPSRTLAAAPNQPVGEIQVTELKCEYAENPLAVHATNPRFSWVLTSQRRDKRQQAYQIVVASSPNEIQAEQASKWDSGRVESDRSVNVPYDGLELKSGDVCFWKVRVWDEHGNPSPWSNSAQFEMGLVSPGDWQGKWIGLAEK